MIQGLWSQRLLLGCLLGSFCLSGGRSVGADAPPVDKTAVDDQRLTDDDRQILEVVLQHITNNEFALYFPGARNRTRIILGEKTALPSYPLGRVELRVHPNDKIKQRRVEEIEVDLKRRNPKELVSLATFKTANSNVTLGDLVGRKKLATLRLRDYPDARGFVETWLPGYSKDGQTAVLMFEFGPTSHGATATYMPAKRDGQWRIVARASAVYL